MCNWITPDYLDFIERVLPILARFHDKISANCLSKEDLFYSGGYKKE